LLLRPGEERRPRRTAVDQRHRRARLGLSRHQQTVRLRGAQARFGLLTEPSELGDLLGAVEPPSRGVSGRNHCAVTVFPGADRGDGQTGLSGCGADVVDGTLAALVHDGIHSLFPPGGGSGGNEIRRTSLPRGRLRESQRTRRGKRLPTSSVKCFRASAAAISAVNRRARPEKESVAAPVKPRSSATAPTSPTHSPPAITGALSDQRTRVVA